MSDYRLAAREFIRSARFFSAEGLEVQIAQLLAEHARVKAELARLDNPSKTTVQGVAEEILQQAKKGNAGHRQLARWADALIPL